MFLQMELIFAIFWTHRPYTMVRGLQHRVGLMQIRTLGIEGQKVVLKVCAALDIIKTMCQIITYYRVAFKAIRTYLVEVLNNDELVLKYVFLRICPSILKVHGKAENIE